MEVKFTKEQEELLLKNYEKSCIRGSKLMYLDKALMKVFLLECVSDMLSSEVSDKLHEEMVADTTKAMVEYLLK